MSRLSGGAAADGDCINTLEDALRVALGPKGRGIMLKERGSGILSVTRSSEEIARATFDGVVPPPWLLPLLSSAEALKKRAGDGGKGLLLGALAVSRLDLTPRTVRDLLNLTDRLAIMEIPTGDPPPDKIQPIVRTFLQTRLTSVVLNALLPSVCDWLEQNRDFALKHAQSLCRAEEISGSVSGTVCNKGAVISGCTEGVTETPRVVKVAVIVEGSVPTSEIAGTLIVAKKCLEERIVVRLVAAGAAVIHGLTDADAQLIAEADCTEVEVKCVKGGVWVAIPGVRQLVVHAPVATLAREITRTVQDALALVCYSDSRLVRVGALERCLLRRLLRVRVGKPPPVGREFLLTLSSSKDDGLADDTAGAIVDLVSSSPEMMTVLGEAVSAMVPRVADSDGLEPVTVRLGALSGALSAGSRCMIATTPLPARRLHS